MKRSHQVALLLMGTVAVGGGAYALMPSENCPPNQPGVQQSQNPNCHRSSSSSGHYSGGRAYSGSSYSGSSPHMSSQQNFAGGAASGGSSATHPSGSGVARGGFGSFASHFSGGG